MEKLLYVTLRVPAAEASTAQTRRATVEQIARAIGSVATVVEVSDEAKVETVAQIVTAVREIKQGVEQLQKSADEIHSGIPELTAALAGVSDAVKVLVPDQKN